MTTATTETKPGNRRKLTSRSCIDCGEMFDTYRPTFSVR